MSMNYPARVGCYLVLIAVGMASGCSSHGVYPEEWKALPSVSGDSCPVITGVYWNPGERAVPPGGSPQYSPPFLSSVFFEDTAAASAQRVRITGHAESQLKVELLSGPTSPGPRILKPQEHYRCEGGWLLMKSFNWIAENASGFESVTYRFRKASDGALVVQVRSSGIGVAFVIPFAGSSSEWHRFFEVD